MLDRNKAQYDFDRAKNKADWLSAISLLTGKNYNLIDYNEVRKRLGKTCNLPTVTKEIPIASIVGTVSRNSDFTRSFLPKMAHDRNRWVNVMMANDSQVGVPPIDVYQIGEVYFVLDGHHRISVMKSNGGEYIMANVRVINRDVPLSPTDSADEIVVKTERQALLEKLNIEELLPEAELILTMPGQYPELTEHILVHKYFMGLDLQRDITDNEAVKDWYENVYMPVVTVIRRQNMLKEFPNKTETELYLWIENNKAELTEEYGENLRNAALAWKLDDQYGARKRSLWNRIKRAFFLVFSPDMSDWGVRTGDWRREFLKDDCLSPLIRRMMVSVRDLSTDGDYLRSCLRFSKQYDAWVGVVHIEKDQRALGTQKSAQFEHDVNQMIAEENVRGKVFMLSGDLLRNLSDRAFWSDISFFKMKYRPQADGISPLESGWNSIIMRVPGPIFLTPQVIPDRIGKILVAFAQSGKAREALYFADALSKSSESKVVVLISGDDEKQRDGAYEEAKKYCNKHNVNAEFIIKAGSPAVAILSTAKEHDVDLILMGGYTRALWKRFFLRSSIEKVMAETSVPLIICK